MVGSVGDPAYGATIGAQHEYSVHTYDASSAAAQCLSSQTEGDDANPWMTHLSEEETQELRHRLHVAVRNNLHVILVVNKTQVSGGGR